jgi:hypothetical protein
MTAQSIKWFVWTKSYRHGSARTRVLGPIWFALWNAMSCNNVVYYTTLQFQSAIRPFQSANMGPYYTGARVINNLLHWKLCNTAMYPAILDSYSVASSWNVDLKSMPEVFIIFTQKLYKWLRGEILLSVSNGFEDSICRYLMIIYNFHRPAINWQFTGSSFHLLLLDYFTWLIKYKTSKLQGKIFDKRVGWL